MFEFKDKKDFTLTVRIEKQRLSEKEGYYFHNYEPEPWVVEITGKACGTMVRLAALKGEV